MDLNFIKEELQIAGWKDIHSGIFLGFEYDLIGTQTKLFNNENKILIKYIPRLNDEFLNLWRSIFNNIKNNSKYNIFILCLITDEISEEALQLLQDNSFPKYSSIFSCKKDKGAKLVIDLKNYKIYGNEPYYKSNIIKEYRLAKKNFLNILSKNYSIKTDKTINSFYNSKIKKVSSVPKVWIGFILSIAIFLLKIYIINMCTEFFVNIYKEIHLLPSENDPYNLSHFSLIYYTYQFCILSHIIFFIFCFYRFHKIMDQLTLGTYKIPPIKSLLLILVPIINLFGIYYISSSLYDYLNRNNKDKINPIFVGLYFLLFMIFGLRHNIIGLCGLWGGIMYISILVKKEIRYITAT